MRLIAVKDLLFSRACDKEQVERLLEALRWYRKHIDSGGLSSDIVDVIEVYESISKIEDVKNPIVLREVDGKYQLLRGSCRIATALTKGLTHLPVVIDGIDPAETVLKYRQV